MTMLPTVTERGLERRLRKRGGSRRDRTRSMDIVARDEDDALVELRRQKGIEEGTPYRDDLGVVDLELVARDFDVRPLSKAGLGARRLYRVTVGFRQKEQKQPTFGEGSAATGAVYNWGRSEEQVELEQDLEGVLIQNSRRELYSPPVTVLRPARTLEIRWYVSSYSMSAILDYDGVVNSDPWRIGGRWPIVPGQALSHGIDPVEEGDDRILMVWQISFRSGGRLWSPLEIVDYTLEGGRRILLDGDGEVLAEGEDPVIGEADVYPTRAFGTWGV